MRQKMMMTMMMMMISGVSLALAHPAKEYRSQIRLSEEQRALFQELRREVQKEQVLADGKIAELRSRMKVELMEAELRRDEMLSLHREISEVQKELELQRMEMHLQMFEGMTPEQRVSWEARRRASRERSLVTPRRHREMLDRRTAYEEQRRNRVR
jgi:hypothetical protein